MARSRTSRTTAPASVDVGAPGRSIWSLSPQWARLIPPGLDDFETDIVGRWIGNGTWARTNAFALSGAYSLTDSAGGDYANDTTRWIAIVLRSGSHGTRRAAGSTTPSGARCSRATCSSPASLDRSGAPARFELAESVDTHGQFETCVRRHLRGRRRPRRARSSSSCGPTPPAPPTACMSTTSASSAASSDYDAESYYFNEGTSMATPHVSGIAALVRAAVAGRDRRAGRAGGARGRGAARRRWPGRR